MFPLENYVKSCDFPPVTGKGTQACFFPYHGENETFIFRPCTAEKWRALSAFATFRLATIYLPQILRLKWGVVKYSGVPLPVACGKTTFQGVEDMWRRDYEPRPKWTSLPSERGWCVFFYCRTSDKGIKSDSYKLFINLTLLGHVDF